MISPIRVAACHVSPVFLSASHTTAKAISLIHSVSSHHANLIVFPETYIPAFPHWSALRAPAQNHDFFRRMAANSILADGPEITSLRSAAKATGTLVSIGFSERVRHSTGTLYNANMLINSDGEILVHHRKLVPTFFEKLTWSPGDGFGLRVAETKFGRIGGLICGENTNPLARYALMAQGEQIHVSTWPAVWPTRFLGGDDAASERRETEGGEVDSSAPSSSSSSSSSSPSPASVPQRRNYNNVHANLTRAASHAFESKSFGVMCSSFLDADTIDLVSQTSPSTTAASSQIRSTLLASPRGITTFLDPTGSVVANSFIVSAKTGSQVPTSQLQNEEGVLYADLDVNGGLIEEGKQYHDVSGGYQRFDVFEVRVDRRRREPVVFTALEE